MDERTSPYYPPRAGWSRHFYEVGYALRRHLHLEDLKLPQFAITVSVWELLLCLLVPGFSFTFAGWNRLGRGTLVAWFMAFGVFIVWLGHTAANVAFGLMMSMHVSSIIHFLNRAAPGMSVLRRLGYSLAVLFVVGQLIYATGLRMFQRHLFMPLLWNERVYVVNPRASIGSLHRGDIIAVHTERIGGNGVWIQEGYTLDRLIALPGDVVQFRGAEFVVNQIADARKPMMPAEGDMTLGEKTWLVWPSLTTLRRYNVGDDAIQAAVLRMAQVHPEQIIGRPYRRWFWRDQTQ